MHAEMLRTSWHICMESWTQGTYLRTMWLLQSLSCAQVMHLLSQSKSVLAGRTLPQLPCSSRMVGSLLVVF